MKFSQIQKTRESNRIRIMRFAEKNGLKSYETMISNHIVIERKDENDYITCNLVKNIKEVKSIIEEK